MPDIATTLTRVEVSNCCRGHKPKTNDHRRHLSWTGGNSESSAARCRLFVVSNCCDRALRRALTSARWCRNTCERPMMSLSVPDGVILPVGMETTTSGASLRERYGGAGLCPKRETRRLVDRDAYLSIAAAALVVIRTKIATTQQQSTISTGTLCMKTSVWRAARLGSVRAGLCLPPPSSGCRIFTSPGQNSRQILLSSTWGAVRGRGFASHHRCTRGEQAGRQTLTRSGTQLDVCSF